MPGFNLHYASGNAEFRVELKGAGEANKYTPIPGVQDESYTPADATTTELTSHDGRSQTTGAPGPGTLSLTVLSNWLHDTFDELRTAHEDQTSRKFDRILKGDGVLFTATGSGNSVAVAANTGVCTFAGTDTPDFNGDEFKVGQAIMIGTGKYYIIRSITDAGVVTVRKLHTVSGSGPTQTVAVTNNAAAVAATEGYVILHPDVRYGPFTAKVTSVSESTPASDAVTGTVTLAPSQIIPKPVIWVP